LLYDSEDQQHDFVDESDPLPEDTADSNVLGADLQLFSTPQQRVTTSLTL